MQPLDQPVGGLALALRLHPCIVPNQRAKYTSETTYLPTIGRPPPVITPSVEANRLECHQHGHHPGWHLNPLTGPPFRASGHRPRLWWPRTPTVVGTWSPAWCRGHHLDRVRTTVVHRRLITVGSMDHRAYPAGIRDRTVAQEAIRITPDHHRQRLVTPVAGCLAVRSRPSFQERPRS